MKNIKLIAFFVFSLMVIATRASAQCPGCTINYSNYTSSAAFTFSSGTACFSGFNSIGNDVTIQDAAIICVGTSSTLNLGANNYTINDANNITVNVYGTLNFNTNPSLAGKWTFNIYSGGTLNYGSLAFSSASGSLTINNAGTFSGGKLAINGATASGTITNTGAMTLSDDLYFHGTSFYFSNNSNTTLHLKTIALDNSATTFTIDNYKVMDVSSTLNLNNGTGQFRNFGKLTVVQNYNSSPTSTYVNCGTFTGSFNLNSGGKVINTGTFTASQIEFGSSASYLENFGIFTCSGSINNSGPIYNEGIFTLTQDSYGNVAKLSGTGNLTGPPDSSKKGYFVWSGSNSMNGGVIGPNLDFKNSSGTSSAVIMFNNSGSASYTWLSGLTWGDTTTKTFSETACPNADGTPAIPEFDQTNVCVGVNLTLLQPTFSNVTYEWWTGTSTSRTTQITSPSSTNYTTVGVIYLWAKDHYTDTYSPSGTPITVVADPTVTISPSSSSVCLGSGAVPIATTVSGGVGTVSSTQWSSSTTSGGTYTNISGATSSPYNAPTATVGSTYYKVYVTQTGRGCDAISGPASVTVNALPTINLASSASSVCYSESSQSASLVYSSTTNTPTTYSITWNGTPSNSFATVTNTTLSSSPIVIRVPEETVVGTYTGYLSVKNAAGCASVTSSAFTITVNALPKITLAGSTASVCYSASAQTTTLAYSSTTNTPTTYSITWSGTPSNSFAAVTNATLGSSPLSVTVPAGTATGTYTGTLTVKNANGCSSTNRTFTVTVNPLPNSTYILTPVSCYGGKDGAIVVTGSNGSGSYQYSIDGGSNYTSPTQSDAHTFPDLVAKDYSIKVKDTNGCISTP